VLSFFSSLICSLFVVCTMLASPIALAAPVISPESLLKSGRRMLPIDVPIHAQKLTGKAPLGQHGPYQVLTGSSILWEGSAGEAFTIIIPPNCSKLYLLSRNERNLAWQQLAWTNKKSIHLKKKVARLTFKAENYGITPESSDIGPALRKLIEQARQSGATSRILIPKGIYQIKNSTAHCMSFYTSNHDQQDIHPIGIPLVDLKNFTLDAQGSTIIFHGKMMPMLVMDSKNVSIQNINIASDTPFSTEAHIVENENGSTLVKIPEFCRWKVENGIFYNMGDGWCDPINNAAAFRADGRMMPLNTQGDLTWSPRAEQVGKDLVRFNQNTKSLGMKKGDVLILRRYSRPHPALCLYRAKNTTLIKVVMHDAQGMALLAQRSENVRIIGGGCIRSKGRMHTTEADATHFSNMRGSIIVKYAHYESMMDDAINVHSTCLRIEEVKSPTQILCRYVHNQAFGFEVFLPGEKVQFIKGPSLENNKTLNKVKSVKKLNERQLLINLEKPLPKGIGKGDAIENADWYPSVSFLDNTVRWNRARGSLFTTPKKVVVKGNKFLWGSGSAILLAGDAQGWYESGACQSVRIEGNLFEQNLTSRYQFTEGIISIYPEVKEPNKQKRRYHRNILIKNNKFITHRVPLVFAISAENIIFKGNRVQWNNDFPGMHNNEIFVLRHCDDCKMEEPKEIKASK